MWPHPHPGSQAGSLPLLPLEELSSRTPSPQTLSVVPFPGMRSWLSRFQPGERRGGETNEEFALNAYFLKTINNQNSLKDHGNCFEKR